MGEKKEHKAVAKKLITPNMQEWLPVSPKILHEAEETEQFFETEDAVIEEEPVEEEPVIEEEPIIEEPVIEEPVE